MSTVTTPEVSAPEAPEAPEAPAKTVVASLDALKGMGALPGGTTGEDLAQTAGLFASVINQMNTVITANKGKRGLDEIAADLFETSSSKEAVKAREALSAAKEALSKIVLEEAKAVRENAGEPDAEAEAEAIKRYKAFKGAFESLVPANLDLTAVLPEASKPTGAAKAATPNAKAAKGATSDLSVIRDWASQNGYPDVAGKRGRIAKEILDAYSAAHPA